MVRYLIVLLTACCTGLYFNSSAQEKNLFIGLKGGISIPNLTAGESKNDWNQNYTSRIGPYFGVLAEIPLSRHFSFQPEFVYAAEGGKRKGIQPMTIPEQYLDLFQAAFNTDKDYLFADLRNVSRINYLHIPLLLKFSYPFALNGKLAFFAQAGPYLGYLISAKQIVKAENLKVYMDNSGKIQIPEVLVREFFGASIDTAINARNDLHNFNTGIQGGIGFSYITGKSKFFIEGGGNYGFIPAQKGDAHGKNNIGAGTVLLGYAYNIHKKKAE